MKTKLLYLFLILNYTFELTAQTTDQSFTGTSNNNTGLSQNQILGQSFTAGIDGALTNISFDTQINSCTEPITEFSMTVEIIDGDGFGGSVLASEPITIPIPYSRNMFLVTFTTPTNVVSGQMYTIRITPDMNQICDEDNVSGVWFEGSGNPDVNATSYVNGTPYSWDSYFSTAVSTNLGVNENSWDDNQSVYPNPTNNKVYIALSNNTKISNIKLFDTLGRLVKSISDINNPNFNFEISGVEGIYLLQITDNSGLTTTRKIIKN